MWREDDTFSTALPLPFPTGSSDAASSSPPISSSSASLPAPLSNSISMSTSALLGFEWLPDGAGREERPAGLGLAASFTAKLPLRRRFRGVSAGGWGDEEAPLSRLALA